jgi:hypothetical protein
MKMTANESPTMNLKMQHICNNRDMFNPEGDISLIPVMKTGEKTFPHGNLYE